MPVSIRSACLLVLLFTVSLINPAYADITAQWTYAGINYDTEAAAVAAMQAAHSDLTVQSGITNMNGGSIQYKWTAPVLAPTSTTVYYGSYGQTWPTESAALTYEMQTSLPSQYQNQCGTGSAGPGHGWVYSNNLGSPSYGPGYTQLYDFIWWNFDIYSTPQCGLTTSQNALWLAKWQVYSCPTNYGLSSTP